jgi:hypothetical protein
MSRELPYFKFFTSEWLNGDITLEDYELQGLFINVCSYYWHKECKVTYEQLIKKFHSNRLVELIGEFMTHDDETNRVYISFLDEQFKEFAVRKEKLSQAGKKGAAIKAMQKDSTTLQPPFNNPSTIREEKIREEEENIIEDNNTSVSTKVDGLNFKAMLSYYNQLYDKKCSVISDSVKRSFNARLKDGYTKDDIRNAMLNVKQDSFHKEQDYKYATLTYFSRAKTLDTYGQEKKVTNKKYVPR